MNVGRIFVTWVALLALLAATIAATFAPLGPVLLFVSYAIAAMKAGLIAWIFMEMRVATGLQRLALAAGVVWALILFILIGADPLTRAWLGG